MLILKTFSLSNKVHDLNNQSHLCLYKFVYYQKIFIIFCFTSCMHDMVCYIQHSLMFLQHSVALKYDMLLYN
jgi:hypothetical protein